MAPMTASTPAGPVEPEHLRRRRAGPFHHRPPQGRLRSGQSRLDDVFRYAQCVGHFRRAQPFDLSKYEYLARPIRQPIDRPFEQRSQLARERLPLRVVR